MSAEHLAARGRAWRAARSLHWNRLLLEVVEVRIERAEAALRAHLALSEESRLELGAFTVECEGEELQVTRRSVVPSGQLELPEVDGHGLAPADSLEAPIAAVDPSSLQESGRDV